MSLNTPNAALVFTGLDWTPAPYKQSVSRFNRKCPPQSTDPKASRNKREGYYKFKVRGRHVRKHRPAIRRWEDG